MSQSKENVNTAWIDWGGGVIFMAPINAAVWISQKPIITHKKAWPLWHPVSYFSVIHINGTTHEWWTVLSSYWDTECSSLPAVTCTWFTQEVSHCILNSYTVQCSGHLRFNNNSYNVWYTLQNNTCQSVFAHVQLIVLQDPIDGGNTCHSVIRDKYSSLQKKVTRAPPVQILSFFSIISV